MSSEKEHCYHHRINISVMKALGMWPYDKSRLMILRRVIISMLLVPYLCMQFSVFVTTQYTIALLVKVLALACPFIITVVTYFCYIFKSKTEDLKKITDKNENNIVRSNVAENQSYIILAFTYTCLVIIGSAILQCFPIILDVVSPLDQPRRRNLLLTVGYSISQNNYFYIRLLHEFVFVTLCMITMFATSAQMLIFGYHILSLFKIARYRIKYSLEDSVLHAFDAAKEHALCKRIMYAVIAHRRAIEFSIIFTTSLNKIFCVVVVLTVLTLSVNLFGIIGAVMSNDIENATLYFLLLIGILLYLFLSMYVPQKVTDYNNELFNAIYDTSWYLMPVTSQKLILVLLQKTGKEFYLKVGFIFEAKIENFAMLLNISLSYVTMMYNCSNK